MNLNFAPMEQMMEKEHDETFNFGLNHQNIVSSSSSSSASCRIFFNPTQDHMEFYHPQDEYYGYHGSYEMENKIENGLKLSPWKKEDEEGAAPAPPQINGVKWINSSKQDHVAAKIEVKKVVIPSSSVETHLSSSYNCNSPIRVCSDCHTTKTPLWRSGPKGPKSLCNACGIRQRKARRAMAAAASGGGVASTSPPRATKVKEKMGKPSQLKKRCNLSAAGGSSNGSGKKKKKKKMGNFEDFLINWSNKLAIHRVFPQDEKEAAILLMALSSGLVHG